VWCGPVGLVGACPEKGETVIFSERALAQRGMEVIFRAVGCGVFGALASGDTTQPDFGIIDLAWVVR